MCFSVNNTFPYAEAPSDLASYLDIKIKFFASKNICTVTDHVVHRSGLIPKPTMIPSEKIFIYPSWSNLELRIPGTKEEIVKLTKNITKFGFPSKGTLILQGWSTYGIESGAFTTDGYPQDNLISSLHSHEIDVGTRIWYPILVQHELTQKYCIKPTNYCDFSSPDACKLFLSLFLKLKYEKQIDLFHLSAHTELFSKFQLNDTSMQKYPSALATKYVETVFQAGATVMSEFAFKTQHLPVWVRLCNYQNVPFEQLLHELIPSSLSVSIAGYSFILPYSEGGFEYEKTGPSEEVFIRMAQAITFMPSVSFSARPWDYSVKAVEIVKKYVNLHIEHAPLIVELAKQRIQDGSPIVRPLWYSAPDDERTYTIEDVYMLGNDILVAPVVKVGQTECTVYFTAGNWIDQHGQSFKGPGEFKVNAPLEELPYFKRKL